MVAPAILYTILHKKQVKHLQILVGLMLKISLLIYFIGLTSQHKEKMSLKATANFVIRNIGKLLSMSQLGG